MIILKYREWLNKHILPLNKNEMFTHGPYESFHFNIRILITRSKLVSNVNQLNQITQNWEKYPKCFVLAFVLNITIICHFMDVFLAHGFQIELILFVRLLFLSGFFCQKFTPYQSDNFKCPFTVIYCTAMMATTTTVTLTMRRLVYILL